MSQAASFFLFLFVARSIVYSLVFPEANGLRKFQSVLVRYRLKDAWWYMYLQCSRRAAFLVYKNCGKVWVQCGFTVASVWVHLGFDKSFPGVLNGFFQGREIDGSIIR